MGKVVVVGSINMDIVASTVRHPKPGETIAGTDLHYFPGGKGANQAVAAARAGADTLMLGNIGTDGFADELTSFLEGAGVNTDSIKPIGGVATGTALIIVDSQGENSIVVVPGANGRLEPSDIGRVTFEPNDVVIGQFEVPLETVTSSLALAHAKGAMTILNPAPVQDLSVGLSSLVDVLVMNETELSTISGVEITADSGLDNIQKAVKSIDRPGGTTTIITLGARGAVALIGDRSVEVKGYQVQAIDTTGAGDCFVGVLGARLAEGDSLEASVKFANVAASICVERPGAGPSMPTIDEIRERTSK